MDLGIRGRKALVTGGSRGIGRSCALTLAREGVDVAICARREGPLVRVGDEIRACNVKALEVKADMGDPQAVERLYNRTREVFGSVDILVNNVGAGNPGGDIGTTAIDEFIATFRLNLFAGLQMMKLVVPHMKEQKWGRIINIASLWGREYGGDIGYMSAKTALIAATKHAALSLAKDGVLVNTVAPGFISHRGGSWEWFQRTKTPEAVQDFVLQSLPMGKFGSPDSVADLVVFLASERASLITGACISVDGGQGRSLI